MQKSKIYNPMLDSIRGLAALFVVVLHYSTYLFPKVGEFISSFTPLVEKSYLFVDMFFVLSGYVLALNYYGLYSKSFSFGQYINFIKKRFIRLYPVHLVSLLLLVFLYWGLESQLNIIDSHFKNITNLNTFILNLGMLHSSGLFARGCYECTSWNYPAWSISSEWIIYFFMPILFLLAKRFKKLLYLSTTILLLGLYLLIEAPLGSLDFASLPALYRCLVGVLLGISIYIFRNLKIKSSPLQVNFIFILSMVSLHFIQVDTVIVILFSILIFTIVNLGSQHHWLESNFLVWLGKRSYSIYMFHAVLQLFIDFLYRLIWNEEIIILAQTWQFLLFILSIVLVLIIGHLSYEYIEKKLTFFIRKSLKIN